MSVYRIGTFIVPSLFCMQVRALMQEKLIGIHANGYIVSLNMFQSQCLNARIYISRGFSVLTSIPIIVPPLHPVAKSVLAGFLFH